MNELTALIETATATILDEWTAEAVASGVDTDDYIADKLDGLEDTDPDVVMAVGQAHLRRMFA